jgi:hypothetical protein
VLVYRVRVSLTGSSYLNCAKDPLANDDSPTAKTFGNSTRESRASDLKWHSAAETKLRLRQNNKLNHSAGSIHWSEDQCRDFTLSLNGGARAVFSGRPIRIVIQGADSSTPFHVRLRLRAHSDSKWKDSVWAQLSDAVDQNGSAIYRHGEGIVGEPRKSCSNCGLGWQDGAYSPVSDTRGRRTGRSDQLMCRARTMISGTCGKSHGYYRR